MVMVAALKGPMTYGSTHFFQFSVYTPQPQSRPLRPQIRPLKPQIWPLNSQIRPFTPQIRAPGPQIKLKIRSFGLSKAKYTATLVACKWAGAVMKVTKAFGQEQ